MLANSNRFFFCFAQSRVHVKLRQTLEADDTGYLFLLAGKVAQSLKQR